MYIYKTYNISHYTLHLSTTPMDELSGDCSEQSCRLYYICGDVGRLHQFLIRMLDKIRCTGWQSQAGDVVEDSGSILVSATAAINDHLGAIGERRTKLLQIGKRMGSFERREYPF